MEAATVHTVDGRQLTLEDDDFSTNLQGYLLPMVSWRMRIEPAYCEHCSSQIHGPVRVHWMHGLKDNDTTGLLKIEARDTVRVVEYGQKTGGDDEK